MADDRIEIEIVLDDGSIQKGFAKVRDEAKKTSRRLNVNFGGLQRTLVGLTAAFAGVFAGRKILAAAQEQENAVKQLNTSLRLAGSFSNEASQSFQQFASELQNVTRFGDEQILQQTALARNFARTNDEAKRLVSAAVDLSEATGITLDSAVRNLGKTFSGLQGEIGESVPAIRELTQEQLRAGGAIDLIAQRFGGAALANVQTFDGRIQQLANSFGDVLEEIGFFVTKSPTLIAIFGKLVEGLVGFGKSLKDLNKTGDVLGNVLLLLVEFANGINTYVVAPIEFTFNLVRSLFDSLKTGIQTTIALITGLLAPLVGLLPDESEFVKKFNTFQSAVNETLVDFANETNENFGKAFDFNFATANAENLEQFKTFVQNIKDGPLQDLKDTSDEATNEVLPQIFENFSGLFFAYTEIIGNTFTSFGEKLNETVEFSKDQSKQLAQGLNNILVGGITNAIKSVINAVASGKNAFEALGKSILSLLGDLAIFIGQFLIATGIAKDSVLAAPGGPAISAGIGLIALGAILKALGGSGFAGGSQGADAVGGGGGAIAPSPGELIAEQEETALEPVDQTRVALTIQGDVLDSRETGLRIVDLLNESFDTEGTVLAT